jgi:peptidoglycan/xylan/chitin deacetylase (PgdA/CDA1 family)
MSSFLPFPSRRPPLSVLLTVDVEFYADTPDWRATNLAEQMKQHIWGITSEGEELGLRYELEVLKRHDLRATFMVESLHTLAAGTDRLKEIVSTIGAAGQDIELHTHTEWMEPLSPSERPVAGAMPNLADYRLDEQEKLLRIGVASLEAAGVKHVVAHRAGNFGANNETLAAAARAGLAYDSSYNVNYLSSDCQIRFDRAITGPAPEGGLLELPVGWFYDVAGHTRPMELGACSFAELQHALWQAWHAGWEQIVIVFHAFELIWRGIRWGRQARPRRLVVRRFGRLCEHLDLHRSYFKTVGFHDIAPRVAQPPAIRSNPLRTAGRLAEQIVGRIV